ncbi:Uncharacterised protein [Klebsiella pneumoniae]|jgi:hypothetical protein|uniref:Uncharacterized protein n=1 Tax=Klebsiella pneumoniae TaxID=573 RepID=A0A486S414_KLEPN|nr:hypothetical protein MTE1_5139 [Klebsiella pneumoniae JHCK1]OUH15373.1 hypothetical protein AZ017_005000 [Klebsiella pneumoniae]SAE49095.1 Uncharacterised protein [Enterobacter hormaechei]SLX21917.1 Uncharacterised protein [Klebsiella variicola]VAL70371.1 Uncharacterised protein [Enterobacter kobei]VGG38477.1 Uncharacterised protein [Klebsiella quasipneumoniae]GJK01562.1 hypothetical protein TUM16655_50110 [Enterobacter cloacae]
MRTKPANRSDTLLPGGSPDDVHPTQSAGKLYSHTRDSARTAKHQQGLISISVH